MTLVQVDENQMDLGPDTLVIEERELRAKRTKCGDEEDVSEREREGEGGRS